MSDQARLTLKVTYGRSWGGRCEFTYLYIYIYIFVLYKLCMYMYMNEDVQSYRL